MMPVQMKQLLEVFRERMTLMIDRIAIFDFDGTLIDTPLKNQETLTAWERATGFKWPHKGWWGRPESLDLRLPMSPKPDVVRAYTDALNDESTLVVIMTGRHKGLKKEVLGILKHFDISLPHELFLSDGPTLEFKLNKIKELHSEYPNIKKIEMWEDRIEHVVEFKSFSNEIGIPIEVNYVKSDLHEASKKEKKPLSLELVLDEDSRNVLLKKIRPKYSNIFAHHVTMAYKPSNEIIAKANIGEKLKIEVVGYTYDNKCQTIAVKGVVTQNKVPHITISTVDGTPPKYSNELLERGFRKVNPFALTGVVTLNWR